MSSKYWSGDWDPKSQCIVNWAKYITLQVLTVIAGIAALYIGSIFQIGLLTGIGGTFFGLYLMEKWYDIPWDGVGWAWSLLGLAVFLYSFVVFAQKNPEYFLFVLA